MSWVSVVLPTYRRPQALGRAIQAVIGQTFSDWELVVVDDASGDATPEVVFSFHDRRLSYVEHKINQGVSSARNTGLRKAKGDYIAFCDHDDEYLPEKLEEQVKTLESLPPNYGFTYSDLYVVQEGKKTCHSVEAFQKRNKIVNFYENCKSIGGTNMMVRRECLERSGFFDETLGPLEDWDFLIRISKSFQGFYLKKPLYNYYVTSGSITSVPENYLIKGKRFYEKYESELSVNPRGLLSYLSYMGIYWAQHCCPRKETLSEELKNTILFWERLYHDCRKQIGDKEVHVGFQLLFARFYDVFHEPALSKKYWLRVNLLKPFTREYTISLLRSWGR